MVEKKPSLQSKQSSDSGSALPFKIVMLGD